MMYGYGGRVSRMKVIGLTGGVGSGKSLVAKLLSEECGAQLLISDDLGHGAMEPGTESFPKIVERFGEEVVKADGTLDREILAQKVFQDEQARKDLNGIIHPVVIQYIEDYISQRKEEEGIIVLESAILFETGCDRFCDSIWYVHVSDNVRKKRLADNRGYALEKSQSIMEKQLSEQEFFQKCHVVIENDGTIEELKKTIFCHLKKSRKMDGLR